MYTELIPGALPIQWPVLNAGQSHGGAFLGIYGHDFISVSLEVKIVGESLVVHSHIDGELG